MNKQIISFNANEQRLVKNERVSRYSSNKVAYVEAQFELGDNWTGYDSVRAVWFTDSVAGISTVLDLYGTCIVPSEVLRHRGKVHVNLVGSISEGNALILKRSLLDGICFEPLAEEFGLSVRQVQNIVYKTQEQLFKHL